MMAFRDRRMSLPSSPQHGNRPCKASAAFLFPNTLIPPRGLGMLTRGSVSLAEEEPGMMTEPSGALLWGRLNTARHRHPPTPITRDAPWESSKWQWWR